MINSSEQRLTFQHLGIQVPADELFQNSELLGECLEAFFLLRETLEAYWGAGSADLAAYDAVLTNTLTIAAHHVDLPVMMRYAQHEGWVENGSDLLRRLFPDDTELQLFRAEWFSYYEQLKPRHAETVSQIPEIGVVGRLASGKGTVAKLLSEDYRILALPFSERLRSIALTMGIQPPYNRGQLREIDALLKPTVGKPVFEMQTLAKASRMVRALKKPDAVVVDGFRSVEEAEYFVSRPHTCLIALEASPDIDEDQRIRFELQLRRLRGKEDTPTLEQFQRDDNIERKWINPVIDFARQHGTVIINDGRDLGAFKNAILNATQGLLKK